MRERLPEDAWLRRLHALIIALFFALVFVKVLVPALADPNFGIVVDEEGGGWTSDFAAHLTLIKAIWAGEASYDVHSHLRVTSRRAGRPVEHALPLGYAPTVLWILGPLCLLPTVWAYVIWTLLGASAAAYIMLRGSWIWLAVAFFTPLVFQCFKLGQTALLTMTGFFCLVPVALDHRSSRRPAEVPSSTWREAIVLWGLSAKPPLAVTAGAALLSLGRWKPVVQGAALTLASLALLIPVLGIGWVPHYLTMLTHYDLDTANPAYIWSIVPETMGNLRALLHCTFGIADSLASRSSSVLWLLSLIALFAAGRRAALQVESCWSLGILSFLLLCPHVTATEDLHLIVILALISYWRASLAPNLFWVAVVLILVTLFFGSGAGYRGDLRIPIVFGAKAVLAVMVCLGWMFGPPAGDGPANNGAPDE